MAYLISFEYLPSSKISASCDSSVFIYVIF
jgi:hypothetical protein